MLILYNLWKTLSQKVRRDTYLSARLGFVLTVIANSWHDRLGANAAANLKSLNGC